jgi:hypothetical protein
VARGRRADDDGWSETEDQRVKVVEVDSSMSEKPEHQRPRRLADWINPTGARKAHSLIDKVYKRKNRVPPVRVLDAGNRARYVRPAAVSSKFAGHIPPDSGRFRHCHIATLD